MSDEKGFGRRTFVKGAAVLTASALVNPSLGLAGQSPQNRLTRPGSSAEARQDRRPSIRTGSGWVPLGFHERSARSE